MPSNRYTNAINLGDWVAVFTGRDYTAVAFVGVVLSLPTDESPDFVVHIPKFNKYCLAGDADLLGVYEKPAQTNDSLNRSDSEELILYQPNRREDNFPGSATFAEITFGPRHNTNTIAGTYRNGLGTSFTFNIARSVDGPYSAEFFSREVGASPCIRENPHLTVHSPELDVEDRLTWVNLLRRAFALDHVKSQLNGLNKQSFGFDDDFEVRQ